MIHYPSIADSLALARCGARERWRDETRWSVMSPGLVHSAESAIFGVGRARGLIQHIWGGYIDRVSNSNTRLMPSRTRTGPTYAGVGVGAIDWTTFNRQYIRRGRCMSRSRTGPTWPCASQRSGEEVRLLRLLEIIPIKVRR